MRSLKVLRSKGQLPFQAFVSLPLAFKFNAQIPIRPENRERRKLYELYADKLFINPDLTRQLVSFQANKAEPYYRWLKYKEGFASEFIQYILARFMPSGPAGHVLDPFAGAGTTLTTATRAGYQATGIELLPIGIAAMKARLKADIVDIAAFEKVFKKLTNFSYQPSKKATYRFPHLRITAHAFPASTEDAISAYQEFLAKVKDEDVRFLLWTASMSCLEDASYTRKDGQYLRWDYRSGKGLGKKFNKGRIWKFQEAVLTKLSLMLDDIRKRSGGTFSRNVKIIQGSCLEEFPRIEAGSFDLVVTSPPYCNRYDYTRTYALELAYLGYYEDALKKLRQTLLSATVENKTKRHQLEQQYTLLHRKDWYEGIVATFEAQRALHEALGLLEKAGAEGHLNNNNIPTMVENYFFEMNIVIHELARILAPGGHLVMVNDNVQYNGEEIPVDLILSDFAVAAGLEVDVIWVLPRGKGNSSQQMGVHGRNEIRKCVYVWSKPQ